MQELDRLRHYERTVVKLRWFLIFSVFALLHILKPGNVPISIIDGLLLVACVYNLAATLLLVFKLYSSFWLAHIFIFLDFSVSAAIIFYTGGIESKAVPLFYCLAIMAGIVFGPLQSIWIISVMIATYILFFFYNLKDLPYKESLDNFLLSLAFLVAFCLLGAYIGYGEKHRNRIGLKLKRLSLDLEKRVTTLSIISRIQTTLNSTLKLEEIFNIIVETANRILKPDYVTLMLYHPQSGDLTVEISRGLTDGSVVGTKIKIGEEIEGWLAQNGKPLLLTERKDWLFKHLNLHKDIKLALSVPLKVKKKIVGVLNVCNLESDYCFTEEDLNLLSILAAQGAAAIVNAQLFEQVVQRARETMGLIHISEKVGANLNLDQTLEMIIDEANRLLSTKYNTVRLVNEETQELEIKIARGLSPETLKMIPLKVGKGVMGKVAKEGTPLIINDLSKEPLFDYFPRGREKASSLISVPLKVGKEVIGVLSCATEEPKEFTSKELRLLCAFGNQAALAIQRARLYQEVQQFADALLGEHEVIKSKADMIIHSMAEGVLVTDDMLDVVLTNHVCEDLLGLCWEELICKNLTDLVPGFADQLLGSEIIDEFKKGAAFPHFEYMWQGKVISANFSSIFREGGDFLGVVGLLHDVTEEKELDRMKAEFVSIASHELRTPMTAIKGNISLLLRGDIGETNNEVRGILKDVYEGNERLIRLVEDMLSFSKIEEGCIKFNKEKIQLGEIIRDTLKSLASLAYDKELALEYEESSDLLPLVVADPDKVRQILWNLIGNAIKFTSQGSVKVRTRLTQDRVVTEVTDTGIGIDTADREKIFGKYVTADKCLTTTKGGGLGLYICKYLVEEQGGYIWVESEKEKGSTFSFSLPVEKGLQVVEAGKESKI